MPLCAGTKRDGGRCATIVKPPQTHCYQHDAARAGERHRAASKAARSKPGREIRDYKQEVKSLIADVKAGGQDRADAAVMLQGYRVLKDFAELERKVKETDELEARIEELARDIGEDTKGGRRWGTWNGG
jgi:hypothetical protein